MKRAFRSILVAMLLAGCHSGNNVESTEPTGCPASTYTRGDKFTDVETIITAKTIYTTTGSHQNYYVNQPEFSLILPPWEACNLPAEYKQDSLAVRISGYLLTYPTIEQDQPYAYPIELTKIEKQ